MVLSPFDGRLIRLRAIEEEDLAPLQEMFWNPDVTRHLTVVWPEPLGGMRAWWEGRRSEENAFAFAIETLAGELIGGCDFDVWVRSRTGTLGIWIGEPYWSQGYGTDAVRILCRFAFREANLQRMQLDVYETNPRGRRAYERVGFKEEGRMRRGMFTDGRYIDIIRMGLLAEDLIDP